MKIRSAVLSVMMALLLLSPTPLFAAPVLSAPRTISFEEAVKGEIEIELSGSYPEVVVFVSGTTLDDALKPACSLQTSGNKLVVRRDGTACSAFDPLWKGDKLDVRLGLRGSAEVSRLTFTPPAAYSGDSIDALTSNNKDKGCKLSTKPKLPASLTPVDGAKCQLFLNKWHEVSCTPGAEIPEVTGQLFAALEAAVCKDNTVPLYASLWQDAKKGWRKLEIKKKAPEPQPEPQPEPPTELDLPKVCEEADVPKEEYRICVHVPKEGSRVVRALDCSEGARCKDIGGELRPNRRVRVLIWHEAATTAEAAFSGDLGYVSGLYDATKAQQGGQQRKNQQGDVPPSMPRNTTVFFPPLKPGKQELTVTVTPKAKADTKEGEGKATFKHTFYVRTEYWGALRLGLAFFWTPAAQQVGVATAPNGQKYVAITGSEPAAPKPEIVIGLTKFISPMSVREGDTGLNWGLGFRLGLLSLSDGKVSALKSVTLGLEAGFGLDFALGVYGGGRFIDVPQRGHEPGTILRTDTVPVETTFVPTFGLALSLTPDFMKTIGMNR